MSIPEHFCVAKSGLRTQDALQLIRAQMRNVAVDNQHLVRKSFSVRSAPNTATMHATISGMIEYAEGVHIHGGYYGIPQFFPVFLKIGGGIADSVRQALFDQLADRLNHFLLDENSQPFQKHTTIYCENGTLWFSTTDGTNWGGIGVNNVSAYIHNKDEYAIARSRLATC